MNNKESRAFLRGELEFTPQRMMRYIRSRARIASNEDIEDILQNALVLVTVHYDPSHPDAKLAPYCLGACNKAIAQNLERYHKIALKKREVKVDGAAAKDKSPAHAKDAKHASDTSDATDADDAAADIDDGENGQVGRGSGELSTAAVAGTRESELDGSVVTVKTLSPGKSFDGVASTTSQYRTTSLDSMFDSEDGRNAEDIFGMEMSVLGSGGSGSSDPASRALINDLVERVIEELPPGIHRTCFALKYVEGYKREDLIECLKMDAKSIDTIDKKIVRTLKAFKDRLDQDEARI